MKILVTGGAGFIGSHLTRAFLGGGHEVLVVDDLSSGKVENLPDGVRFERADIRSSEAAAFVERERPEILCHHAAQMNVRVSVEDPDFDADVNVGGFINLLEAARRAGTRRVVFASSGGAIYGEPEVLPTSEDQTPVPLSPYGVSKLCGEHYLEYYRQIHGLAYVALRYANVYGPRQDPHGEAGVIAIFCRSLLGGEAARIFGDGLQTRDYVYVGDVVRANLACLDGRWSGAVNIGTGRETSVVELHEELRSLVGVEAAARHEAAKPGEVRRSVLDCTRAADLLGWKPETRLADGLAAAVEFFRNDS